MQYSVLHCDAVVKLGDRQVHKDAGEGSGEAGDALGGEL
jgi:hypothetical protein